MVYRSILVHVDDNDAASDARADAGTALALERSARLAGIAPTGWVDWYVPVAPVPLGMEDLSLAMDALREAARRAAERFRARCTAHRAESLSVQVDDAGTVESLVRHAVVHDLLVMSQPDPAQTGRYGRERTVLEQVLLHSPRPVLVLPHAHPVWSGCRTVVLAWNGSREAARAAADAMPLLTAARTVHLLQVEEATDLQARIGLSEAADWLRWHGVAVEPQQRAAGGPVAGDLLSSATAVGADLLVLGAYGHARWMERVLGGATRGVLDDATLPVLMSH